MIGNRNTALSSRWFDNNKYKNSGRILANNAYNFLKNIANAHSDTCIWTAPLSATNKSGIEITSFKGGFLSMNARATNEYQNRNACAYLVNRFENPIIQTYFRQYGLEVNEDLFALSELVQWLFRSAIRNGEPISLYIPSRRMRKLLEDWLNGRLMQNLKKAA